MSFSLILTRDHDGRRLDRTLRSIWPALPLSAIMRAIRKGEVRLDSKRVHEPGERVHTGQELYVLWEAPGEKPAKPLAHDNTHSDGHNNKLPVLWRGEGAMIVNKPSGLLVQPDVKNGDSVITRVWNKLNAEKAENIDRATMTGFSPAAVHRLDRNTTGVLVVALRGDSLRALEALFKAREIHKRYLAITVGRAPDFVEIDAPLLKDAEANTVRVSRDGQRALSRCTRIAGDDVLSLVSVELITGRTHQARVHLAHIGCPILGDRKYGNFDANRRWSSVKRPMLHAFEISFPDELKSPLNELAGKVFRSPLPNDMALVIQSRTQASSGNSRAWSLDEILGIKSSTS